MTALIKDSVCLGMIPVDFKADLCEIGQTVLVTSRAHKVCRTVGRK